MGVDMVLRVHPGLDLENGRTEFDPSLAGQDANQPSGPSPVNQVLTIIETVAYLGQSEVLATCSGNQCWPYVRESGCATDMSISSSWCRVT